MSQLGSNIVSTSIALVSGNFLGAITDRVAASVSEHLAGKFVKSSLIDSLAGIFLHVGLISVGTNVITSALPYISEDPSAFSMYLLGLWSSSPQLKRNLRVLNILVLNDAIYAKAENSQRNQLNTGAPKPSIETLNANGPRVL